MTHEKQKLLKEYFFNFLSLKHLYGHKLSEMFSERMGDSFSML